MDPDTLSYQDPNPITSRETDNAVRLQTLLQVEKLLANSMDPRQTAQAGLDPCWLQKHFVGFVMTRLKCISFSNKIFY
jgi:hypothetical protein